MDNFFRGKLRAGMAAEGFRFEKPLFGVEEDLDYENMLEKCSECTVKPTGISGCVRNMIKWLFRAKK